MNKFSFNEIAINSTEKKKPEPADKDTYLGLEHLDSGSLKVKRFGADVAPIGDKLVMKKGDVLFGKRRAYQKKVAIAPFDGIFSAHGMVLRPREEVVDKDFFPLFISSDYFLDVAIKISVGSLSPTINWNDLKVLEFSLPELAEQKKIAKVIWAALDLKEAYQKMQAACDEIARSRFIEMFGEPGQDHWGMGLSRLSDCCILNPRRTEKIDPECMCSFVAMPSVGENGEIDTSIHKPYKEVCKGFTYFAENDVLFAKITPCMQNGKGAIAQGLVNDIGFGSTEFHVLRPQKEKTTAHWLFALTKLPSFRHNAEMVMTGTGGQQRVPASFLADFMIACPPLALQNEFATFSEQLDKSKFSVVFYVYGPVFPVFCRGPPEKSFFYRKFVTQMPDVFTFFQNDIGG